MVGCQTLDVERLIITFAKIIYSVRGDSVLHLGYFHIFSAPVDNNNLVEKIQIRLRIYWRNSLGRRAGELKQPEFEKCQKCLSVLSSHLTWFSLLALEEWSVAMRGKITESVVMEILTLHGQV